MKKLLIFLVLVGFTQLSFSQSLIQTFTDRCTGETKVFSIAMEGSTTVVFFNKSRSFTAADVTSGVFQAWLEETYAWWLNLSPCSTNQSTTTSTQTTTQQTTANAAAAANNATSSAANTNTGGTTSTHTSNTTTNETTNTNSAPETGSTNQGNTNDSGSTNSTDSTTGTANNSSDSSSGDSTSGDSSGNGDSSTSDSSGGSGGDTQKEEGSTGDGDTSESDSGETTEENSGESDDSSEDSKKDESSEKESESESEESESTEDEESETEEVEEEEAGGKKKNKKKKKQLTPPIVTANLMTMQMLDGTFSTAASFGISQSSLTGVETYSLNTMIWSNLQQFMIGGGVSTVYFKYDRKQPRMIVDPTTGKSHEFGYTMEKGSVWSIDSHNINFMYMFGTKMASYTFSQVYMGQKDNFWKGFVGGYAATNSAIFLPESTMLAPSLTFFGTKPVNFKALPRWGFSPMVALSLSPLQILNTKTIYNKDKIEFVWNKYFTYILGTNVNFSLTQRFIANLGINTINNTDLNIPTTFAITIGARFNF